MDTVILDFLNLMFTREDVPTQFKSDIVVPLLKRDSRFVPKNYRPISLVQTTLKGFQSILYARVHTSPSGVQLTGKYNFGSVKGRDRHMLMWMVNSAVLWEMYTEEHGVRVIFGAWDVEGAFPSIWQDGVDWLMWKAGVRGKLWRNLRNMEKKP